MSQHNFFALQMFEISKVYKLFLSLCLILSIFACEPEESTKSDQDGDASETTAGSEAIAGSETQCMNADDLCTAEVCSSVIEQNTNAVDCDSAEDLCTENFCLDLVGNLTCGECPMCPEEDLPIREVNLANSADNLYAWRKTRASLDPEEEVVFYWQGYIYNLTEKDPSDYPGGPPSFESPLFKFEGFNVARFAEVGNNSYEMLSREVSVYKNPNTGAIIDCWRNALVPGAPSVSVMHVINDPVNFGVGTVEYNTLGDRVSFFSDILLAYRSPLAGNPAYADYSASDVYQSNELFNFYVSKKDLENPEIKSAPVEISWTRVGQYLPWMQMGDRPGKLVYHVRGFKVAGGVDALPAALKTWTVDVAGEKFMHAPETVPTTYSPNATTWRVFKEILDNGSYQPSCE